MTGYSWKWYYLPLVFIAFAIGFVWKAIKWPFKKLMENK